MPRNKIAASDWEINWNKRRRVGTAPQVWARNRKSEAASARRWHWTTYSTLINRGVKWINAKPTIGRHVGTNGYVTRHKSAMSPSEIAIADSAGLWMGASRGRNHGVKEHQLIATLKYGRIPPGFVVRHVNGKKDDNAPDNLVLGTRRDNYLDHRTAVTEMIYWRERALLAEGYAPEDLALAIIDLRGLFSGLRDIPTR